MYELEAMTQDLFLRPDFLFYLLLEMTRFSKDKLLLLGVRRLVTLFLRTSVYPDRKYRL